MASKQLGKLRQWAGEKISLEKKTVATEEFKDLEQDVELRRQGVERLYVASEAYWKYLAKKKEIEGEQSMSAIESLAMVMVAHGEEFGDQSAYGQALTKFGQAHFKLATLQEQYAEKFRETYLASLERYRQEVKEYHATRRKLKSRRLAYDAAISQSQKQLRKDKEREVIEEEVRTAQARFEEVSEEAQLRMTSIQDREIDQFKDLSHFLEMETKFTQAFLEILKDLKRNWIDESEVVRVPTTRISGPTHISRATTPGSRHPSTPNSDLSEDENESSKQKSKRSNSNPPFPPARQRSSGWSTSFLSSGKKDKTEKSSNFEALEDQESDGDPEKRITAPTAFPSSRSHPPVRSTSLRSPPPTGAKSGSKSGFSEPGSTNNSPLQPLRALKSTERLKSTKIRRALYDFTATNTDELTMIPGDEVQVISEPSESWWLGECRGRRGLFPVSYTEDVPQKPPLPVRLPSLSLTNKLSASHNRSNSFSELNAPNDTGALGLRRSDSTESWDRKESQKSGDEDEPFGDHYSTSPSHQLSPAIASPETSDREDDERGFLVSQTGSSPSAIGADTASSSAGGGIRKLTRSLSKKGPPPPPPVRRSHTFTSSTPGKSPTQTVQAVGQGASPFLTPTTAAVKLHKKRHSGGTVLAKSPFASHRDHDDEGSASPGTVSHRGRRQGRASGLNMGNESDDGGKRPEECSTCDCDEFQQNPFKPDGYCKSCFHHH